MDDKPFIMTNDKNTADLLLSAGFELIMQSDEYYFFENDPDRIQNYSQDKFAFTNKLFM